MLLEHQELGEISYFLLGQIQNALKNFNDSLDFKFNFDANDLKVLQKNDNEWERNPSKVRLRDSVLLRYLPLPMLLHSEGWLLIENKTFLEIFRSDGFEEATLIWNPTMLSLLRDSILRNLKPFFVQLVCSATKERCGKQPQPRSILQSCICYPNIM